ncbi:ATP-binding protein [Falsiroseomonas selenitidurans]|uniref:histidine kinase n=1 Tax=Falsiroseomonas selenitidurans TaxID=2716335 RepID=A0ABX1E507_9PROT|nr:ATP-binding protein [Falsiroseomonas selenitidurans]NKC32259.1 PAS domain-containing protein [Falsiroseomonas selenitidurans]
MDGGGDEAESERTAAELEQLRVALEDVRNQAADLLADRNRLADEVAHARRRLREVEGQLMQREAAAEQARSLLRQPAVPPAEAAAHAENLQVALEELQVIAEELEQANTALAQANALLEQRVKERTAELAAANARLRDSEERLRLAQSYAGAGTWDWDILNDRVEWSEEYFDLYGLDPSTVRPSYAAWVASIHSADRAVAEAALQACLRRTTPEFKVEYRILHPHRGLRWLSGRGRLVCDRAGRPVRLIGLNLDITDRKLAELTLEDANRGLRREVEQEVRAREAAQAQLFQTLKLEALGQLTGGVAHDFNNLLSVITSGIALLRTAEDPARREKLAEAMAQAARRGADLTRRLLTFARRQTLHPGPLELRGWLTEMRELLARTLRGDITIEIEMQPDLWPVLVDAGELELALLNLAVNARDAMPRGGRLRLRAQNASLSRAGSPDLVDGDYVRLCIADNGIGMTPDVLSRAFEPFFTTKEAGHGTGLGLAQVYGFVRQSGGAARVQSEPGRGTTVSLLLPRAPAEAVQAASRETPPQLPDTRPLDLLLVEDDEAVAALTADMLRHLGHRVRRVSSAAAALRALAAGPPPDLVMTDVVMPGGQDGLDLARRLASERPGLPVVLCSGFSGAPARVEALGLPLLRKPFGLDELRSALAQASS